MAGRQDLALHPWPRAGRSSQSGPACISHRAYTRDWLCSRQLPHGADPTDNDALHLPRDLACWWCGVRL